MKHVAHSRLLLPEASSNRQINITKPVIRPIKPLEDPRRQVMEQHAVIKVCWRAGGPNVQSVPNLKVPRHETAYAAAREGWEPQSLIALTSKMIAPSF